MQIYHFELPLIRPLRVRSTDLTLRRGLYFKEGEYLGECSPLPGFSAESLAMVIESRLSPEYPAVSCGLSMLQRRLKPLPPQTSYRLIHDTTDIEQLPDASEPDSPLGFMIFKIKVGRSSMDLELRMIDQITRLYPRARLILDANMNWNSNQACEFLSKLDTKQILYLEDPTNNLEESLDLAGRWGFKLGLDEHLRSLGQNIMSKLPKLLEKHHKLIGGVIIKPMLTGHLEQSEALIQICGKYDIIATISSSYESPCGLGLLTAWQRNFATRYGGRILLGLDTAKIFTNPDLTINFSELREIHLCN